MTQTATRTPTTGATRRPSSGAITPATAALVLAVVGVVAAIASFLVGSVLVSPADGWQALTGFDPDRQADAVLESRVTRTVLAVVVGAALGVSGAVMQGLTRNPLADPGLLGINAGASFAIVTGLTFFGASQSSEYLWFGFAGAALTTVGVHAIAAIGRDGSSPVKLAIAGAAISAALTSWTSGVLLVDKETMTTFRFWQVGSVGGRGWEVIATAAPFLAVGLVLALLSPRMLNAMSMGEDIARGLGRRTGLDRAVIGLAVVLLAGAATAIAGPFYFVGLLGPHIARRMVGSDYRRIIPVSLVLGALLVMVADTVGRIILPPSEVQAGIMVSVIGVPVFVMMVRRGRLGAL